MSDAKNQEKTLEVKMTYRKEAIKQNQADISRAFFPKEVLLQLGIRNGDPCEVWKLDDIESRRFQVIAWCPPQPVKQGTFQLAVSLAQAFGLRTEDRCAVSPCKELQTVSSVVVREETTPELDEGELSHWEWLLQRDLRRVCVSEKQGFFIFQGMAFDIYLPGEKRTFIVESFRSDSDEINDSLVRFVPTSVIDITKSVAPSPTSRPPFQVSSIAGIDQALIKLNDFLATFDRGPRARGFCGILLNGSPGSGKTEVIDRICQTGWGRVYRVDTQGKPASIRDIFKSAVQTEPSIVAIDNLDRLLRKENPRAQEFEDVLAAEMDGVLANVRSAPPRVAVVAATSALNDFPSSLWDRQRFGIAVMLPIPDVQARKEILRSILPDADGSLLDKVGERTHAFTPRDLSRLSFTARSIAGRRSDDYTFSQDDFDEALRFVRPTAMHDVTLQPPTVRWADIGGQEDVKRGLQRVLEWPVIHQEYIKALGIRPKKGLLLYGPPGCSKTLSAQAMATESNFNFFAVKGAELLNMYVGESERAIRDVFARARAASPSVIFFDEFESIGGQRQSGGKSNGVNVLTTLLNEMDGIETLKGVIVLAATNQPEALDLALLRPGRFDDLLYVGLPDQSAREAILGIFLRKYKPCWSSDVVLTELASLTQGYSGAEVVSICDKAADSVLEQCVAGLREPRIEMRDFVDVISRVPRQITPETISKYQLWAKGLRR